jgi:hypothetical protein
MPFYKTECKNGHERVNLIYMMICPECGEFVTPYEIPEEISTKELVP